MLTFLLSLLSSVSSGVPSSTVIRSESCEFGVRNQFSRAECLLEFQNPSNAVIKISELEPKHVGDAVNPKELLVPPHGVAHAKVTLDLQNEVGRLRRYFAFKASDSGDQDLRVSASGFVHSLLDEVRPTLDFGVVDVFSKSEARKLTLSSREVDNLRIEKVLDKPSYLDVQLDSYHQSIYVRPIGRGNWGIHDDVIKVALNSQEQPSAWIRVKSDFRGEVVPSENPLSLGVLRGVKAEGFRVRLTHRSHQNFKVGPVVLDGVIGNVNVLPCESEVGCQILDIHVGDTQPMGVIRGMLTVYLPDYKQKLPILLWGIRLRDDTPVREFNAGKNEDDSEITDRKSSITLPNAIKQAMMKDKIVGAPEGHGPLIKWSVSNENTVFGYIVYRADDANGVYKRVNNEIILRESEDQAGASYQWRDVSAKQGRRYWYYVGMEFNDGTKRQLSGAQEIAVQ